jgi:alpha-mannosidase
MSDKHRGKLPASNSLVKLEPANLVLTTIKKAEDSDAWIFQWYDAAGEESDATLTLPRTPKKVFRSNFLENDGTKVSFEKNIVNVKTKKNEIVTVKAYF